MEKRVYNFFKYITIFLMGGIIYMIMEMLWRGRTHISMGILGGICVVLIGIINEIYHDIPLLYQAPLGSIIITILEYISGYILNITLGLNIWDYSDLPFNVNGQVCLYYSLLWMVLSMVASVIDDVIRQRIFGEEYRPIKFI